MHMNRNTKQSADEYNGIPTLGPAKIESPLIQKETYRNFTRFVDDSTKVLYDIVQENGLASNGSLRFESARAQGKNLL